MHKYLASALTSRVGTGANVAQVSCPSKQVSVAKIKSQIKRNRQNEKRRLRNRAVRSEMNTRTKSALAAAAEGDFDAEEKLRAATKRIDKAAAKGVIHKNTAARRKSRLIHQARRAAE